MEMFITIVDILKIRTVLGCPYSFGVDCCRLLITY